MTHGFSKVSQLKSEVSGASSLLGGFSAAFQFKAGFFRASQWIGSFPGAFPLVAGFAIASKLIAGASCIFLFVAHTGGNYGHVFHDVKNTRKLEISRIGCSCGQAGINLPFRLATAAAG